MRNKSRNIWQKIKDDHKKTSNFLSKCLKNVKHSVPERVKMVSKGL